TPVTLTVERDLAKVNPLGSATVTVFSCGASRPAVSVNDSLGWCAPTLASDTCESVGLPWIVHANDVRTGVPDGSDGVTVTVEAPTRRGLPVIFPLEELIDRPDGSRSAR